MLDSSEIQRSHFLSKTYRNILEDKNLTIQEVADKLGNSHAYISQNLSGKKVPSDKFFIKVGKAIGLKESEIKDIFKQADKEEYKYKYGEEINDCDSLDDISLEVALKKEFGKEMNPDTVSKIREFINFVNSQEK